MPAAKTFTPKQAAARLGVAPSTVRYWIRSGKLKAARCHNGYWLVREHDLEGFARPLEFKNHKS